MKLVHFNCMIRHLITWKTCFLERGSKPRSSQKVSTDTPDLIGSDSVCGCSVWVRVIVLQWSWLELWFIEPILISSSSVVPVFVSLCIWSGAPCLRHHVVRFPFTSHMTAGAFLTLSSLVCLFFTLLSPQFDILPLCTVLHQQSIGRPLSGYCSCSNTSQSHHQGQKEELRHLTASVIRCWWAEHHSSRRFLIYFYTIWEMLYTAPLYFFTPILNLIAVGIIYIPLISFLSAFVLQWLQRDSKISLCYLKSHQPFGVVSMPFLSNSFC